MISAENKYEEDAIKFFMMAYGVNPGSYTVVLKRKPGMNQTDGLTVPAAKDKFVVFIGDKIFGAELIRLIAHEVAHVCQIIKGDMEFTQANGITKVFWHGEEVNPDKVPYRKRPWEIEAFTLEKKYVHEFIKKFGNQLQERLVHQDGEWVLLAKSSDRVLKKFGKTKPSEEEVAKEEKRIQYFKHHNEGLQMKTFEELFAANESFKPLTGTDKIKLDEVETDYYSIVNMFKGSAIRALAEEALGKSELKEFDKQLEIFRKAGMELAYYADIMSQYNSDYTSGRRNK